MVGIVGQIHNKLKDSLIRKMLLKLQYTNKEKIDIWSDDFFSIARASHKIKRKNPQPIFNEDKSMFIVMEGEIFDYKKEKINLLEKGHKFGFENDCAEYCLHLFEEYGISGLKKLNGSFLIVIYNLKTKEIYIINDRLGSMPLFYYKTKSGGLIFGSQVSSILQCPEVSRILNEEAIFEFFTFEKILGTKTYYKDINLLRPATVLHYKNKEIFLLKYWNMIYKKGKHSKEDYINMLAKLLKKAVAQRTIEDHKYGLLLSGGLDSRTVLAASPKKMTCFTFADFENNEVKIAKKIAKLKNCNHFFLKRNSNHYVNMIEKAVEIGGGRYRFNHAHGIGFFDKINKECDVIFHGAMLDILFRGINIPEDSLESKNINNNSKIISMILENSLFKDNPRKIFNQKYSQNFQNSIAKSLKDFLKNTKKNNAKKFNRVFDYFSFFPTVSNQRSYLHILHNREYITERFIALDNDLIDFYLEVPTEFRKNSKLFHNAMAKINLPISKIHDANKSFIANIPLSLKNLIRNIQHIIKKIKFLPNWYFLNPSYTQQSWSNSAELIIIRHNKKLQILLDKIINDPNALYPKIFDIKKIKEMFNEHLKGKKDYTTFLFLLLTFGFWCKKYGPKAIKEGVYQ